MRLFEHFFYLKLSQVETSVKNYLSKLSHINQIKQCDNLILKSKCFDSKLKLSQDLDLAQRKLTF